MQPRAGALSGRARFRRYLQLGEYLFELRKKSLDVERTAKHAEDVDVSVRQNQVSDPVMAHDSICRPISS